MAFTRNMYDDSVTIEMNRVKTHTNRYMLDVPGPGDHLPFMEDPFIRMQKWGGNLMTNSVSVEGDLFRLTRNLNKDSIKDNTFTNYTVKTKSVDYPSANPITDQSRATHPAWTYREIEPDNWNILLKNPQNNVFMKFGNNIDTRLNEIDRYKNHNN